MEPPLDIPDESEGAPGGGGEDELVQFTGVWTLEEQQLIRATARELSEAAERPLRWAFLCTRTEGEYRYSGHLVGVSRPLRARTVEDLARRMRELVLPT